MASPWYTSSAARDFAGLRAGWRLTLFIALVAGPLVGFGLAVSSGSGAAAMHALPAWVASWVGDGIPLLWLGLVTLLLARLEKRPFGRFGLPGRGAFGGNFWRGALWGFLGLSLLLALIAASGGLRWGGLALSGGALGAALAWALVFVTVGLFEELCFRGYALVTLASGLDFWPASVGLSALFGALHLGNSGESIMGALSAAGIGLFFCLTLRRTGNLWFAVGLHAAWDYGESFVYGVPDSGTTIPGSLMHPTFTGSHWITGGSVGPEGSLFVFLVLGLLFLLFARLHPAAAAPTP
ncbi:MAG TPA: CPBP family intramembrane glutamic endopeptidase [Terriglobales bacterium]|nr:CPBP family intramembrane glutamic endopeptidase [Terriglobales bacterium]